MNRTLENERLQIEVAERGSELVRIYDKEKNREVLWNGAPAIWPKHSPLLFPMVGQSYQKKYRQDGKEYGMENHGFAWTSTFRFREEKDGLTAVLDADEETLRRYPFPFRLTVSHRLLDNRIKILWEVTNTGEGPMYYNIGAHPAFRMPQGVKNSEMYVSFPGKEHLDYIRIQAGQSGCALTGQTYELPLEQSLVRVTEEFWNQDVYIFEHQGIEELGLLTPDRKPYVTVYCKGFPYCGIWAKPGAPFICLEPWHGRCDDYGFTGELKEKTGIMTLQPGKTDRFTYEIEIA